MAKRGKMFMAVPFGAAAAGLALLSSALLGPGVSPATATPPPPFTQFVGFRAVDLVATPERMLALVCERESNGDPMLDLVSVDPSGTSTLITELPEPCSAASVAIAPGGGGLTGRFPAGGIYVAANQTVYRVTPDGAAGHMAEVFADIPSSEGLGHQHVMAFDDVGNFGFDMLLVGSLGRVYRVVPAGGVAVQFATIAARFGNSCQPIDLKAPENQVPDHGSLGFDIDVAPRNFGRFGGQLLVPSACQGAAGESTVVDPRADLGTVYAVSPTGIVDTVAKVTNVSSISFVPPRLCTLGTPSSKGAFFMTRYNSVSEESAFEVVKFPKSTFAGEGNRAVVQSNHPDNPNLSFLDPDPEGPLLHAGGKLTVIQSNFAGLYSGGFVQGCFQGP